MADERQRGSHEIVQSRDYMRGNPEQKISDYPEYSKIPLVDELNQVKQHQIKTNTILIDDVVPLSELFPRGDDPPTGTEETKLDNLISVVLGINPNYRFGTDHLPLSGPFLVCKVPTHS